MEIEVAIRFIAAAVDKRTSQRWADLGAGNGLFAVALAHVLGPQSTIFAVDQDARSLAGIPPTVLSTRIEKQTLDFLNIDDIPADLDGIIMANSLHFVKDKSSFLKRVSHKLIPGGKFICIEYDTDARNPWVPYPVSFDKLNDLLLTAGFHSAERLYRHPSILNNHMIYSAAAVFPGD